MEQSRWGIIYCPKQGVRRTNKRWEHIKELLDAHHVTYDFVQSESPKSVGRLTEMLCKNGYKTLIIVGGDAALNRALNGILNLDDSVRQQVAIGLIPNGRGNDFATFWGLSEEDDEATIKGLLQQRLRKVDVGYINYTTQDNGTTQRHYFLNCANIGLVANIMKLKYRTRRILGLSTLSYMASMVLLLFQRLKWTMRMQINEDTIDRELMNVCVGNCRGYGQTPSAVPYNGCLDISIVARPNLQQLIEGVTLLFTGQFLNHKDVRAYRTTRRIMIQEIKNATISADGRVLKNITTPLEIGLIPEHINFMIP